MAQTGVAGTAPKSAGVNVGALLYDPRARGLFF